VGDNGSALLELDGIGKRFGDLEAVSDLTLTIEEGEIFTLLGPSGCGKSTTLRMIAGLEHPDTGTITLRGETIVDAASDLYAEPEARNLGMVFQSYAVWPHMTVFDNIAFPLRLRRVRRAEARDKVMATLELVGLASSAEDYPWQLSGGMQQRVALARAIVYQPDMLLLDEPLSNLDAKLREQMRIELKELQRKLGTTFLFVTHDQAEAMVLSTRIAVLDKGRIEQIGTPSEVYERPATPFVRDFLGQSVLFPGRIENRDGELWIDLDLGTRMKLPCDGGALSGGERVTMACRTEGIRIRSSAAAGNGEISAVVEESIYVGERMEYSVRIGERRLAVRSFDDERFASGARVSLGFGGRGVTVWPDDG
jgi:ABC-type Fe3+/spermidine/putrescine transport system ATPase subunit